MSDIDRKYNIVTGLRRSGTSLLMLILRQSGIPIIGFKYAISLLDKDGKAKFSFNPSHKIRKGNPNGYWELGTITTQTGIKPQHIDIGMDNDVIKITSDTIYYSDPTMINKIILIMRHPRNVITSMQKGRLFKDHETNLAIEKNLRDTERTLDFIKHFKHHIVKYEDLLEHPLEETHKICQFLGRGEAHLGAEYINKDLNRSKPYEGDTEALRKLEDIYTNIK